jgi:hypothetical protein
VTFTGTRRLLSLYGTRSRLQPMEELVSVIAYLLGRLQLRILGSASSSVLQAYFATREALERGGCMA